MCGFNIFVLSCIRIYFFLQFTPFTLLPSLKTRQINADRSCPRVTLHYNDKQHKCFLCCIKVSSSSSSVQNNSSKCWTQSQSIGHIYREYNTYPISYFWSACIGRQIQSWPDREIDICSGRRHKRWPLEQVGNWIADFCCSAGLYFFVILQRYICQH